MEQNKDIKIISTICLFVNLLCLYYAYKWMQSKDSGYEAIIVFWGIFAQIIPSLYIIFSQQIKKVWKNMSLNRYLGKAITMDFLEKNFPDITKITVLGLANVGKSTFIENICNIPNKNEITYGKWAYLKKISGELNTYVAILDASGQSNSQQNDRAILSKFLIVILDHNESNKDQDVNTQRISEHEDFLLLLWDKLTNVEGYYPKWIHFLVNKQDTRLKLSKSEKDTMDAKFKVCIDRFSNSFRLAQVSYGYHSNKNTNDCSLMMNSIIEHLQKHL